MAAFYCLKCDSLFFHTGLIGGLKTLGVHLFSAQYFSVAENHLLTAPLHANLCVQLFFPWMQKRVKPGKGGGPLGVHALCFTLFQWAVWPRSPQSCPLASSLITCCRSWSVLDHKSPVYIFTLEFDISINYKTWILTDLHI